MTMKKSRLFIAFGLTFVVLSALVCWVHVIRPLRNVARLDAQFLKIEPGMPKAQVERIMGGEGQSIGGPFVAWWEDMQLGADESLKVKECLRFAVSLPFLPVVFEITFDAESKVIGKHRYD
jgi:hypothetical protein